MSATAEYDYLRPETEAITKTPTRREGLEPPPCISTSDGSFTSVSPPTSVASTLATPSSDDDRSPIEEERNGPSGQKQLKAPLPSDPAPLPTPLPSQDHTMANGHTDGAAAKSRSRSGSLKVRRLSAADLQELTKSPDSLPIAPAPERRFVDFDRRSVPSDHHELLPKSAIDPGTDYGQFDGRGGRRPWQQVRDRVDFGQPSPAPRTASTPPANRTRIPNEHSAAATSPRRYSFNQPMRPPPLNLNVDTRHLASLPSIRTGPAAITTPKVPDPQSATGPPSPLLGKIPLPPMSIPTHLQLEIAAQRPSPLYIHHPHSNDTPYESSAIKLERLKNVLLLPPYLERTLNFGALACLDAWLHTFTILPIRFVLAVGVLVKWWAYVLWKEVKWLVGFVWVGMGRLRRRGRDSKRQNGQSAGGRSRSCSTASEFSVDFEPTPTPRERYPARQRGDSRLSGTGSARPAVQIQSQNHNPGPKSGSFRHKRTKSMPSNLTTFHKADLLQGAVIIFSSMALMTLDASRMYHFIRAQSAIKLYVIYNILEVGDRLLSSLGQDILECLFSNETLSRNSSGRSKVLMPLGMFILALVYNCLHSVALYYQVITLNVAVNSYSNALLTLLLSNQFVEIKSTVFKRCEKDNLFQLTCADIVERFQLWIMLFIIGMRNVVEVGGLSVPGTGLEADDDLSGPIPVRNPSILPHSFTVLPSWLMSGEVLSPFLIVIGSEMLVDSIKHAYVTKFNNIKPAFYSRILDILCRDYYTNAFTTPQLTRRLGLAVIPLSCLFIRASFQTYHMFLSTHLPMPAPQSTQTSLTEEAAAPSSPAMIAALNRFDTLIRDSLGRATYGYPYGSPLNSRPWYSWTSDDVIAALTMIVFFFLMFLVLLVIKLLLGMVLLKYSRNRYAQMKQKEALIAAGKAEREVYEANGRRAGGYGYVEVGEERQRWIHADEKEGLKGGKGPGGKRVGVDEKKKPDAEYNGVFRYDMVAKRIW
ncbi:unnamed protein product [Clonostachys solani]|uniref:Endoplasmic reticulum membrane protein 65 n=1 Tax=Clonostachys solani TaxID=160281 RepID=A0A9N9Z3T1_9HYPO|nr:unnamed protein product [Clonostachys solani]